MNKFYLKFIPGHGKSVSDWITLSEGPGFDSAPLIFFSHRGIYFTDLRAKCLVGFVDQSYETLTEENGRFLRFRDGW